MFVISSLFFPRVRFCQSHQRNVCRLSHVREEHCGFVIGYYDHYILKDKPDNLNQNAQGTAIVRLAHLYLSQLNNNESASLKKTETKKDDLAISTFPK